MQRLAATRRFQRRGAGRLRQQPPPAKVPGYRPNTNTIDAVDKFFSSGASGMRLFG
jgi:hypothetical protein